MLDSRQHDFKPGRRPRPPCPADPILPQHQTNAVGFDQLLNTLLHCVNCFVKADSDCDDAGH